MAQVEIRINNRPYRISCDDGQEDHLTNLAELVDARVQQLVASVGQLGEERLLVMASLLIADELSEASAKTAEPGGAETEADRAAALEALTARIERVTARLMPA